MSRAVTGFLSLLLDHRPGMGILLWEPKSQPRALEELGRRIEELRPRVDEALRLANRVDSVRDDSIKGSQQDPFGHALRRPPQDRHPSWSGCLGSGSVHSIGGGVHAYPEGFRKPALRRDLRLSVPMEDGVDSAYGRRVASGRTESGVASEHHGG